MDIGSVTGWTADRQWMFSWSFYSFTVSAGSPCSIWTWRKGWIQCAVVAKQVSVDLPWELAPARSWILQTGNKSAHGFGSCGYCMSSWAFEWQENVTTLEGICRKDSNELTSKEQNKIIQSYLANGQMRDNNSKVWALKKPVSDPKSYEDSDMRCTCAETKIALSVRLSAVARWYMDGIVSWDKWQESHPWGLFSPWPN